MDAHRVTIKNIFWFNCDTFSPPRSCNNDGVSVGGFSLFTAPKVMTGVQFKSSIRSNMKMLSDGVLVISKACLWLVSYLFNRLTGPFFNTREADQSVSWTYKEGVLTLEGVYSSVTLIEMALNVLSKFCDTTGPAFLEIPQSSLSLMQTADLDLHV